MARGEEGSGERCGFTSPTFTKRGRLCMKGSVQLLQEGCVRGKRHVLEFEYRMRHRRRAGHGADGLLCHLHSRSMAVHYHTAAIQQLDMQHGPVVTN